MLCMLLTVLMHPGLRTYTYWGKPLAERDPEKR